MSVELCSLCRKEVVAHKMPLLQRANSSLLFSLPTNILQYIFTFFISKELCSIDSAILNHTYRPIFLSALIQRFQDDRSSLLGSQYYPFELEARWYLCRRIPIAILTLNYHPCPKGMISMNSNFLEELVLVKVTLSHQDILGLGQCFNLKKLSLSSCSFPSNDQITSVFANLSSLDGLEFCHFTMTRSDVEAMSRFCRSLKSLYLGQVKGVRDDELRILVEGCPALLCLRLTRLAITDKSVQMLLNHRPQIESIGIINCDDVSWESVLSLLKEITIPNLFTIKDEEFIISAMDNLLISTGSLENAFDLITCHSLLHRLVELYSRVNSCPVRARVLVFMLQVSKWGYSDQVIESGIVPVVIQLFDSLDEEAKSCSLLLFTAKLLQPHHSHLLSAGILSIFRPQLLDVRSSA
jgi:hypothetical protein